MAEVRFFNGNQGVWRYTRFRDYSIEETNETSILAEYDFDSGAFEPWRSPWQFETIFEGAETHTFETGPREGEEIYTAGTLTRINYYNTDGDLIIQISDLDVDLAGFTRLIAQDVGSVWEYLTSGGVTIVGSNDSSGPNNDWDGDDIETGVNADTVRARRGDDYIKDNGGQDMYDGGQGRDTLSYDEWFWDPIGVISGITADLAAGEVVGPDGFTDTVTSIESLRGTFLDDTLLGDRGNNNFMGLQGNDMINGRGGFDVVQYRKDSDYGGDDGIKANLARNKVRDGFGNTDRLKNIEGVEGTDTNDLLIDNDEDNYLRGREGDDEYYVSGGDDFIDTDGGNDVIIFRGDDIGSNTIVDFEDGVDLIQIAGVTRFRDLTIRRKDGDAVIEALGGEIRLDDVAKGDLSGADFIFT